MPWTPKPTDIVESVVMERTNGPLIAEVAQLYLRPTDIVVDVTYGRGLFWTKFRPEHLICHDKFTFDGVDFTQLPEADRSADVVVFDPPYVSKGGRSTSTILDFDDRYGLVAAPRTPEAANDLIGAGMKEGARILAPKFNDQGGYMLVKCMDYISGGKFHQGHKHVVDTATDLGLTQVDEFVHYSGRGPQDRGRRQVHSRRAHTFLCVFQAPVARIWGKRGVRHTDAVGTL